MSSLFRRVSNLVWGARRSMRSKDKKSFGRKKKGKKEREENMAVEEDQSVKQTINNAEVDQTGPVSRDSHVDKMADPGVADDTLDGDVSKATVHMNGGDMIEVSESHQLNSQAPTSGQTSAVEQHTDDKLEKAGDSKFTQSDSKERELTESGESAVSSMSQLDNITEKEASILLNEMYADSSSQDSLDRDPEHQKENKTGKKGLKHILRRKISATFANIDFEQCDPEICVSLLKIPSVNTFGALKKKVKSSGKVWIQGFLDANGLDALLDCVDSLGSKRVTQLSDALLLLECVACIKVVMNSKMGLECLVQHPDYVRRLVKALDTSNAMVKKQVFELLSALCVYSEDGYRLALDALETFKTMKKLRYRFSLIINELKSAELVPYKTTLVAFINCILVATDELRDRHTIRNEFIGLNLLDLIHAMRDIEDEDLHIQCDVFDDEKHDDDEELAGMVSDQLDISNPEEVFKVVLQKVYNTPHADVFLCILQSLLQIEPDTHLSDNQWKLMELASRKMVVLKDSEEVTTTVLDRMNAPRTSPDRDECDKHEKAIQTDKILQTGSDLPDSPGVVSPSTGERVLVNGLDKEKGLAIPPVKSLTASTVSSANPICDTDSAKSNGANPSKGAIPPPPPPPLPPGWNQSGIPPPPPPPPGPGGIPPAPPPPPPPGGIPPAPPPPPPPPGPGGIPPPPPPPPGPGGIPPPPPPPPGPGGIPPPPPPPPGPGGIPPPPPPPGCGPPPPPPPPGSGAPPPPPPPGGFRPLSFQPPAPKFQGITTPKPKHKMKTFNWSKVPPMALSSDDNVWKEVLTMSDKVKVKYDTIEQLFCQKTVEASKPVEQTKVKPPTVVNLLDMKRSMNVNIFLKQFKASNQAVVDMIKAGDDAAIGAERLRGLQKNIPETDEITMIKSYDGDKDKLGNAEKFYMLLSGVSGYKVRVEGMLLKDDFRTNMDALLPNVNVIIEAATQVMDNENLKAFLRYVLHTGNFMNAGGYAGNALGFKVGSLTKLMDTRANKPRVTLLHYLVGEAEKESGVLNFAQNLLPSLSPACRLTVDNLKSELGQLKTSVKKLQTQVDKSDEDIKNQFNKFLQASKKDIESVDKKLEEVDELTKKLAHHFCENESSFKMEDCLTTFKTFCEKVKQCQKENEQRRVQEERAEKRKKEQAAMKAKQGTKSLPIPQEDDGCIIDRLLKDIKKGHSLRKAPTKSKPEKNHLGKVKVDESNVNGEIKTEAVKTNGELEPDSAKTVGVINSERGLTNGESAC